jgi:hypothetical protein
MILRLWIALNPPPARAAPSASRPKRTPGVPPDAATTRRTVPAGIAATCSLRPAPVQPAPEAAR